MRSSRTIGFSIVFSAACASAWFSAPAQATDVAATLATIQQDIAGVNTKLSADEQTLHDVKVKFNDLSQALANGVDPRQLLSSAINLLNVNDAVAVDLAGLRARLIADRDELFKLAKVVTGGTGANGSLLTDIKATVIQVNALLARQQQASQNADELHTAIKNLVNEIESR